MPDPIIVGIDPSSKHIAVATHYPLTKTVTVTKVGLRASKTGVYTPAVTDKAWEVMSGVVEEIGMNDSRSPRLAYVESPLVGRGGVKATMVQSFVNGVIQMVLVQAGFTVFLVNVSTWKKVVCGSGNATKENVQELVRHRWPKASAAAAGDGDINDAIAICCYGRDALAHSRAGTASGIHR